MAGTRWVRLDVDYFDNPKVRSVSASAQRLHLASILYAARHLTDGHLSASALPAVAQLARVGAQWRRRKAAELVAARLWDCNDEGWHVHDFESMNPQLTRAAVELERRQWRERQRRARQRQSRSDIESKR